MFIVLLHSCSEGYQPFLGPTKYLGFPSMVDNIRGESLPGQIVLYWDIPSDSNYYFLKINYHDYLTKENVTKLLSVYSDSLLIDRTRARFGEYEFNFQTFNSYNEGGEIKKLNVVSGKAPIQETITTSEVSLRVDQLSTNYPEPTEGPISHLLDGDPNTFFHSRWSQPQSPMPHYLQVKLDEPINNFQIYFQNRAWSQACAEQVELLVSNNGEEWTEVETITNGLPNWGGAEYTSAIILNDQPFTYLRWNVTKTYGDTNYWNMAEFRLYSVIIDIYDPETDEE